MTGKITNRHFHQCGGYLDYRSHPPPSPRSLSTWHLLWSKVFPEEGEGDIYIHLGRRKVRLPECARQTGSGGPGGLGMNHRRIGAWQWMNNPPCLPKPHYFPASPAGPEIHVCACCQFIRGGMSFLFWLRQDRPGGPQEDPALFNSTSSAPLRTLISAWVINTISV